MRDAGHIADPPTDLDIDQALDELFALPPDEFVAARNALAKALRAEKRKAEATEVAAYRRPTRTVSALNRLALGGDRSWAALLDAIDAIHAADASGYREAASGLRNAINDAVDAALAGLDDPRSDDRGDLTGALQSISADADALDALANGRLQEVPAAGMFGFGALGGESEEAAPPSKEPPARRRRLVLASRPEHPASAAAAEVEDEAAADEEAADDELEDDAGEDAEVDDTLARRRAEKARKAAAAAAEKAERALAGAESDAADAEDVLATASAKVEDAHATLERVQAEYEAAAEAAAAVRERRDDAGLAAEEAAEALAAAEADLDALD